MIPRIHRHLSLPLALLLAACQAPGPAAPPAAAAAEPAPAPALQQATPAPPGALETTLRLIRHHWRLVAAVDAGGHRIDALFARPEAPLQLDFNASLVSVGNACNVLSAHHTVAVDSLTIAAFASSMRACPDPALAALDGAVANRLQGRLAMQLDAGTPPRLVLVNAAGDTLTFAGLPTAAARFDGPPQRLFLEVAAASAPCPHPLIPQARCLQVRELHYDAQGLVQGTPGAFTHFYDPIEGYTHREGVRDVLRVDRYPRKSPPADGSRYAYILDKVIETGEARGTGP